MDDRKLVELLVARLTSRPFGVGDVAGRLLLEGLEVDVEIKIRHRAPDREAFRARAIAILEEQPGRAAASCGCDTSKKSRWSGRASSCTKRRTHAVVSRSFYGGGESFSFVCAHHVDAFNPAHVLAVLELPRRLLEDLRTRYERDRDAAVARERALELGIEGLGAFLRAAHAWDDPRDELAARRRRGGVS